MQPPSPHKQGKGRILFFPSPPKRGGGQGDGDLIKMEFFHIPPLLKPPQKSIAAIGNFDGMHRGHQAILTALKALAQQKNLPSTVILFEPQPLELLHPQQAPARLQTLSEKLIFLKNEGI